MYTNASKGRLLILTFERRHRKQHRVFLGNFLKQLVLFKSASIIKFHFVTQSEIVVITAMVKEESKTYSQLALR